MVLVQTFIFEMLNFLKWLICLFVKPWLFYLTRSRNFFPSLKSLKRLPVHNKGAREDLSSLIICPYQWFLYCSKYLNSCCTTSLFRLDSLVSAPNLSTSNEACSLIQDCLGSIESSKPCVFRSFEMSKILTPQSIASLINRRLINFQGVSFRLCLQL